MTFAEDLYAWIYEDFRDKQSWLSDAFKRMTFEEFLDFAGFCFAQFDAAVQNEKTAATVSRKGLIVGIARKTLEAAPFLSKIDEVRRDSLTVCATSYFELARGFYDEEAKQNLDAAWAASLKEADTSGFKAIGAFEMLQPHRIFRESSNQ